MCDDFCLDKSCLSLALNKDFCFISSFPGFFVFGKVSQNCYEELKYFQFSHFEIPKLYSAIIKIVHFLANKTLEIEQTKFLSKTIQNCDINYYIVGNTSVESKVIIFRLEAELFNKSYDILFTREELNNLIQCMDHVIVSCLCLKPMERQLFNLACIQSLEKIIEFQNIDDAKKFIIHSFEKSACGSIIENLSIVLVHYNSIIIILHKLKTLFNNSDFNNEQIEINKSIVTQN